MVNTSGDPSTGSSQYEYIKCVVVGDPGVGKTCLVRAWACGTKYTLQQLVRTHVSTVWATDHYRVDKQVLDRSWCQVDDVRVSLRLWDTFGYHDKDRSFAYKGADVILIVFSVVKPNSLRNVLTKWLPEIQTECSATPIVVVGTHAEMRFMYKDKTYLSLEKGLLYKTIEKKDIILPTKGRDVAMQIGAPYYEVSVLQNFGVNELFFNVIRAAAIERRKFKFWNTALRRINYPLIQEPMPLPPLAMPKVTVMESTFAEDLGLLLKSSASYDVAFDVKGVLFKAHKVCLAAFSDTFAELFLHLMNEYIEGKAESEPQQGHDTISAFDKPDNQLLMEGQSFQEEIFDPFSPLTCSSRHGYQKVVQYWNHPIFLKMELKVVESDILSAERPKVPVVTLCSEITPTAFSHVLTFLYTGQVPLMSTESLQELKTAAEILHLLSLLVIISNIESEEEYLNITMQKRLEHDMKDKLRDLAFNQGKLTDVHFQLDDGTVTAHKSLLMGRCEMMSAMFSDNFRESAADVIPLPGVTVEVFQALKEYIYTDNVSNLSSVDVILLISIANCLCLPRLVNLVEQFMTIELEQSSKRKEDILEEVIMLIEPSQFHNAVQLSSWCRAYVCTRYKPAVTRFGKLFRSLQKESMAYIEENQWPPAWYVKEREHYDHLIGQDSSRLQFQLKGQFSRWQQCQGTCFSFCRKSRYVPDDESYDLPM